MKKAEREIFLTKENHSLSLIISHSALERPYTRHCIQPVAIAKKYVYAFTLVALMK